MDNVKVNNDLSILISDLTNIEQNKLILMATIYTRKMEDIKKDKLEKLKQYLTEQAAFYKRDINRYASIVNKFLSLYDNKLNRVLDQFNIEYKYLQNEIVFAQTNQKIAVANFVASKRGLDKARLDNNLALIEKSNKKLFATAQKKLNYDVIIDECVARLEKCMKDTFESVNEIFCISNDKIAVRNNSFISNVKHFCNISFRGDVTFTKNVLEPLEKEFDEIEGLAVEKVSEIKTEMLISIAQLEKIRNDINDAFNETLNKVS